MNSREAGSGALWFNSWLQGDFRVTDVELVLVLLSSSNERGLSKVVWNTFLWTDVKANRPAQVSGKPPKNVVQPFNSTT